MPQPEPTSPPEHVRAAFGVPDEAPAAVAAGPAWRCGGVVLTPAPSTAEAVWVAQALEGLEVDGVRVPRPLRSSDGRWVVSGWGASRYVSGRVEPRHDEVVAVSRRLHVATADLERPDFLAERIATDLYAAADAAAWSDDDPGLDPDRGGRTFTELAPARRTVTLREQVVHGDLFGNVLFAGGAAPAVVGFTPYWRPPEWAAAVVVVDAVAWGGSDDGLLQRWASTFEEWPQMLLRALLHRVAVHATHPRSTSQSLAGLQHAATLVRAML